MYNFIKIQKLFAKHCVLGLVQKETFSLFAKFMRFYTFFPFVPFTFLLSSSPDLHLFCSEVFPAASVRVHQFIQSQPEKSLQTLLSVLT